MFHIFKNENISFHLRSYFLELTSACKRINKDGCYEFVTGKTDEILSSDKKSSRFGILV